MTGWTYNDLERIGVADELQLLSVRHGSNELDSSSSTERSRPVILSASEGSRYRSRQTLRCAQGDTV